ncbi:hypothetical protein HDV62DRAFT_299211 [Trichoderma sp. SZMC 28011]
MNPTIHIICGPSGHDSLPLKSMDVASDCPMRKRCTPCFVQVAVLGSRKDIPAKSKKSLHFNTRSSSIKAAPRGAAESIAAAMWALAAELYQIVGRTKMAQASCHAKRAVPRMERSNAK